MTTQVYPIAIYVIVILIGRFISQGQRKPKHSFLSHSRAITRDWTALLVALSATVAIVLPVLEAALRDEIVSNVYVSLFGLVIIVVGWGVAYAGNRAIAESWSPTIDKDEEQKLITSGAYAIVRHPLYLSGILIIVGTSIYFQSSWAWLGVAVGLIAILIRVPIEEKRLVERFGQEYTAYQKRTNAILPWIL
jgi:protein-S-isoprenylcysteine O-methyltransferase Ste14